MAAPPPDAGGPAPSEPPPPAAPVPGPYEQLPDPAGPYQAPPEAAVRDGAQAGRLAGAWVVYGVGAALVLLVCLFTLFAVGQDSNACDYLDPRLRPDYCGSALASGTLWAAPLAAVALCVVGGPVGIVLLRRWTWVVLVPLGLVLLAIAVLVGVLTVVT